ncbi:MAG: DUF4394 domain-containing protein [Verrucomicrobiota bacterium]
MKRYSIAVVCLAAATAPLAQAVSIITLVDLGLGNLQALNRINSSAPGGASPIGISGVPSNERLLGIDYRPANGQLYAVSSGSSLYRINTSTGVANLVGSGFTTTLTGASYGFDFNPTIDRIRIVGDSNQNIVAHPDTGAANVAATTPVAYGAGDPNFGADPNVVHHAYTNSFAGATTSQLYGIDSTLNILVTQANNAGTLGFVGGLGVDATDVGGFDIDGSSGIGYAAFTNLNGAATLYSINLATGQATSLGGLQGAVTGIAVIPEPSTVALGGIGTLLLLRRRRA